MLKSIRPADAPAAIVEESISGTPDNLTAAAELWKLPLHGPLPSRRSGLKSLARSSRRAEPGFVDPPHRRAVSFVHGARFREAGRASVIVERSDLRFSSSEASDEGRTRATAT